jgi:hypothetical protein
VPYREKTAWLALIAMAITLKRTSPQDAGAPPDERDRAIMRRSISFDYYVLIAGMIVVGCIMPFSFTGWAIINAALLMLVVAEVVHYSAVVVSYRSQT